MKWSVFDRKGVQTGMFLLLLFHCTSLFAGEEAKEKAEKRLENRLLRYKRGWSHLIPRYGKIQYAGSMGMVSFGTGWDYGRKGQWETDLLVGYLPRFEGPSGHATLTLKENYIPWRVGLAQSGRWKFEPLTASFFINKIFGDEFWGREPHKYPHGYYGLATGVRLNLAFGQRLGLKLRSSELSEYLSLFYEFATNDLYLVSYFGNKYLRLTDIFSLSLGIKFQFL